MTTLSGIQATMIAKLRKDMGTDDLSVDPTATIAAMDKRYSFTSTRNGLAALKKLYPGVSAFADEAKKRRLEFHKLDSSQEPTEKQKEKYVRWEDVLKFRDEYRDQMTPEEYTMLCLYTMWAPVRSDYTPMKVVARKPRRLEDGMNYLIVNARSIKALFHAYKTHSVYGDELRTMPKPLERVVRSWLTSHPGTYLFQDAAGQPYQPQRLGATVRRIFQRFHHMDTGISTLRHSYATHIYKGMPSSAALEKLSREMLHSPSQSQGYRHIELE